MMRTAAAIAGKKSVRTNTAIHPKRVAHMWRIVVPIVHAFSGVAFPRNRFLGIFRLQRERTSR